MYKAFSNIICDGQLWLFIKHKDKQLGLLCKFLILMDIVQLVHQLTIPIVYVKPLSL